MANFLNATLKKHDVMSTLVSLQILQKVFTIYMDFVTY